MARESTRQYVKRLIAQSGMVGKLIAANTVVFLIFLVISIVEKLFIGLPEPKDGVVIMSLTAEIKSYFIGPGEISNLLYRPWAIITQMFTHLDFGHFFFNMIVLFFSGRIFVQFFGERRLLSTYLLGGIFAYLFHVLAFAVLPVYADVPAGNVLGASGAIFAIFIASVVYRPSFIVYFFGVIKVPLFIIGALYVLSTLTNLGSGGNVAHFVHLGGAIFGALSVFNAHAPSNFMHRFDKFFFWLKLGSFSFKTMPKMKVYV